MVYIPEYVVGHWWENLLHNQSALRLKGRLLFTAGDADLVPVPTRVGPGGRRAARTATSWSGAAIPQTAADSESECAVLPAELRQHRIGCGTDVDSYRLIDLASSPP